VHQVRDQTKALQNYSRSLGSRLQTVKQAYAADFRRVGKDAKSNY